MDNLLCCKGLTCFWLHATQTIQHRCACMKIHLYRTQALFSVTEQSCSAHDRNHTLPSLRCHCAVPTMASCGFQPCLVFGHLLMAGLRISSIVLRVLLAIKIELKGFAAQFRHFTRQIQRSVQNAHIWQNFARISQQLPGTFGDLSGTFGDLSGTFGDLSGTFGDLSGTFGDLSGTFRSLSQLRCLSDRLRAPFRYFFGKKRNFTLISAKNTNFTQKMAHAT